MGKKRKRSFRETTHSTRCNKHHLLFQGKHWNSGPARELRGYFIYSIPISIHNELHHKILKDVPIPPPEALKSLYKAFLAEIATLDQLDVLGALKWLEVACDYEPFATAIHAQAEFLEQKLGQE